MLSKADVLGRKKDVSDRISGQVRTLSVSVVAVTWLFLVPGKDGPPPFPRPPDTDYLLIAGASALLALVADFLQYVSNYVMVQSTLAKGESTSSYSYDENSVAWKASDRLFWIKQGLLACGFLFLATALVQARFGEKSAVGVAPVALSASAARTASPATSK